MSDNTQISDRELLELAAKAAGVEGKTGVRMWHGEWNPLDDDGDALRLAVKLEIVPNAGEYRCSATWWERPKLITQGSVMESTNGDPYTATRRAIVRAAAEIGRSDRKE